MPETGEAGALGDAIMNDDLFGMETMPDSPTPKELEDDPSPFGSAPGGGPAASPAGPGGFDQSPLDGAAGVAGVDFPQMTSPGAGPAQPPPPATSPAMFGQSPAAGAGASQFPEFASGSSAPPAADRTGPRHISIGGGGLGALGASDPKTVRPASLVVPSCIGVPGLAAAAYLWLIVGTWPLAAVAAGLSVVGALFCWVLLKG